MFSTDRSDAFDAQYFKAQGDALVDAGQPREALEAYAEALALGDHEVVAGATWGQAAAYEALGVICTHLLCAIKWSKRSVL